MDVRDALKGQYHAAYRMLRECVELCPDEMWTCGDASRFYWKIAYHAAFYGHLYMVQNVGAFKAWHKHADPAIELYDDKGANMEPYTKAEVLEYIDEVRELISPTVDALDLDTPESGFDWYPNMTKLEHELLSVRHIQGHVGQLSERLFAVQIDSHWMSRRA